MSTAALRVTVAVFPAASLLVMLKFTLPLVGRLAVGTVALHAPASSAVTARLLPVPVDDQGLDTARLPEDRHVRLAYTTPSHQFPLGAMLPIGRRQELLRWAARRQAWIIEDDYDGEFRYGQRPIDALHAIDKQGRVLYIGTFSKALSPQLRLGFLDLR